MDQRQAAAVELAAIVASELSKGLDQIGLSSEVVILLKPDGAKESLILSFCKAPGTEPIRAILESAYEQILSRTPDIYENVDPRGR